MALAWIKEALDKAGVDYHETHHSNAFTAQEVAQNEHVSGHKVAKVVAVIADGRWFLLVVPASRKVLLPRVKEILRAENARLATEKEMQLKLGDCDLGAIPPLPHWKSAELWVDTTLRTEGTILFQAGTHEDGIRMKYGDWFELTHPRCESFTAEASELDLARKADTDWLASQI